MTPSSPDSPNILGEKPLGFTDHQREAAMRLKARIQNGENIPLEELRLFILAADSDLTRDRIAKNKATPEIDFF